MAVEGPTYLIRAGGSALVAFSVLEFCELMVCVCEAGDEVEAIHAYYSVGPLPTASELDQISRLLAS